LTLCLLAPVVVVVLMEVRVAAVDQLTPLHPLRSQRTGSYLFKLAQVVPVESGPAPTPPMVEHHLSSVVQLHTQHLVAPVQQRFVEHPQLRGE
jgi:hypothetical protein